MKDILFVTPFPRDASGINEATVSQPLGIAYISALLEKNGFVCRIIDANILKLVNETVLERISQIRPALVGISINVVTGAAGMELSRRIKEEFKDILVILGGPQACVSVDENLSISKADALVSGEGEITMLEIANRIREASNSVFKGIRGVIYKNNAEVINNGPRERITDLDSLPHPAYHLLPDLNIYFSRARRKPAASIITSRGCPFQCIYCNKSVFGSRLVALSAEKVLDLLEMLIKKYGVRQVDVYDDNFTLDKKRVNEIFEKIIERKYDLAINLQTGVRADSMDRELIFKMKKAGVFKIGFGVESGSPAMLQLAKKQLDLKRVLESTKLAKKAGIMTYGFFILGLPGETEETLQQTIDFAKKMDPVVANFCIAMPFLGTEMYDMVLKKGKFLSGENKNTSRGFYGSQAFFEYGGLKEEILLRYYRKAYSSFYFRPKKMIQTLMSIQSLNELRWVLAAGTKLIVTAVSSAFKHRKA